MLNHFERFKCLSVEFSVTKFGFSNIGSFMKFCIYTIIYIKILEIMSLLIIIPHISIGKSNNIRFFKENNNKFFRYIGTKTFV